uniref:Uncharacterized protein n=1 Tax=Candidatus Kentrum sp. TUN TaxID=2126343 RepID=A0A451A4N2_9GAMM|nr:MAG: hypothetical protein BECKTUN1418D_GA0071000_11409 [Candidatus Kentron sp. TUN]
MMNRKYDETEFPSERLLGKTLFLGHIKGHFTPKQIYLHRLARLRLRPARHDLVLV